MSQHTISTLEALPTLTVADVMTKALVTTTPDARLSEVAALMQRHNIKHLPVLREGRLVGLVTERHLRDAMPSVLLMRDHEARIKALGLTHVSQVWIPDPECLAPETSLLQAIHAMRRLRAGSMPVTRGGELVGIVTSGDLLTLLERVIVESGERRGGRG